MIPCTFTATPIPKESGDNSSNRIGIRQGQGKGQSMKVSLELDLDHPILDTGISMPLLKQEYSGIFRRDVKDSIHLMPVMMNEDMRKDEKENRQEDRFEGMTFENCTVVDHPSIVSE